MAKKTSTSAVEIKRPEKQTEQLQAWPHPFWPGFAMPMPSASAFKDMADFMDMAFSRMPTPDWISSLAGAPGVSALVAHTDIDETDQAIDITMEVPGMTPEDVTVEIDNDRLIVSGKKSRETSKKDKRFEHVERRYGEFRRVIALSQTPADDAVDASMEDGVLRISIAKATGHESSKPKNVDIRAA